MKYVILVTAYAVLLALDRNLADGFTLSSFSWRSKPFTLARLEAATDITAAINTVMRSIPPPHIPAESVIRHTSLLVALWDKIAFPNEDDADTDFKLSDYGMSRKDVGGFIAHFQTCKDCAADHAFLMATQDDSGADVLRLSNVYFSVLTEVDSDDDWGLFNPEQLGDEIDLTAKTIFPVEMDDNLVLEDTKEWVQRVIADFGVCPFTIDKNKAGIPMGGVHYAVSRAVLPELAFLRYWEEVEALLAVSEKEVSTVLLVFPELTLFGNYEMFEAYCESLSDALCGSTMGMESEIQLVFFHPKYQFRDGQARTGEEKGAANFARRSPWPMINILRTPQVKAAQKGVPTGQVYQQNEERLGAVGTSTLETMLYDRNWDALPAHAMHNKGIRKQELLAGAPLSVSTEKVIFGRVEDSAEEVPGVCPFPHGMSSASHSIADEGVADIEIEALRLVELMDSIDSGSGSEIDYIALANEVERWLAQEELERNQ
jgi:hypothetical protein